VPYIPYHCLTTVPGSSRVHVGHLAPNLERHTQTQKLRAFGVFAGAGAMSLGMANATGGMKTTHAVEISPSAARTFRYAQKGLPRGETGDLYGRASNSEVFFLGTTRPIRLCTTSA
jgi:hypothetical protein